MWSPSYLRNALGPHGSRSSPESPSSQVIDRSVPSKLAAGRTLPRVLVVYPIEATFVQTDVQILNGFCDVRTLHFSRSSHLPTLLKEVARADVVFAWFALGFAAIANVLSRALGKKSILVSGGWDVVGMPEIKYGTLLTRRGRLGARWALATADSVLAFSEWSTARIRELAPTANVRTVYLGVDTSEFVPQKKENLVVCVAHVSRENLIRKGLREFVRASARVPEARFVLVGEHWDETVGELRREGGSNIEYPGRISDRDLRGLLAQAKVYVQPSYTEGFGLALVEAMSAGCVPVVTNSGALSEVVGEVGYYVEYGDVDGIARAIRMALESHRGAEARSRVEQKFRIDQRSRELRDAVMKLWPQAGNSSTVESRGAAKV